MIGVSPLRPFLWTASLHWSLPVTITSLRWVSRTVAKWKVCRYLAVFKRFIISISTLFPASAPRGPAGSPPVSNLQVIVFFLTRLATWLLAENFSLRPDVAFKDHSWINTGAKWKKHWSQMEKCWSGMEEILDPKGRQMLERNGPITELKRKRYWS